MRFLPFTRGCRGKARQSMSFETGGLRVNQQQSSKDFFQWSTTDEGRKRIGQNVILIGGVAVATVSWCWNMFLVDWMKDDTMDSIDIFYTKSLDPVRAGLARGSQGAVVGIPEYMLQDEVDLTTLRVKPAYNYFHKGYRLPSNLCQEAVYDLQRTMVLTTEEREFVMARELARVNTWAALRETLLFPLMFVGHYVLANELNTRTGLINKSRPIRWAVQLGFGAAALFGLIPVKNFHLLETDQEALTTVCKTPQQAEIAMNFYQKMLNRNKVLRQVLGSDTDGDYCFTEEGEFQPFFYEISQVTSLRVRRDFMRDLRNSLD